MNQKKFFSTRNIAKMAIVMALYRFFNFGVNAHFFLRYPSKSVGIISLVMLL